jgi:hypothetical protein
VPIAITGLASIFVGRKSPAHLFLEDFLWCAGLFLPIPLHPFESGVVYDGFRSDTRQDHKDMKKMPFLPYPPGTFSWAIEEYCRIETEDIWHECTSTFPIWHLLPHSRYSDSHNTGQTDTFWREEGHHDATDTR